MAITDTFYTSFIIILVPITPEDVPNFSEYSPEVHISKDIVAPKFSDAKISTSQKMLCKQITLIGTHSKPRKRYKVCNLSVKERQLCDILLNR